jgi:hypothetical protein
VKKRIPSPHVYPLPGAPFMRFWNDLSSNCELREIINEALEALREDRCAGIPVGKNKMPRQYRQFGIDNLYKMNLRENWRLVYTLIARNEGVCPHVIEVMAHTEYLRRFGYRK